MAKTCMTNSFHGTNFESATLFIIKLMPHGIQVFHLLQEVILYQKTLTTDLHKKSQSKYY
jgi:hypothetical protein